MTNVNEILPNRMPSRKDLEDCKDILCHSGSVFVTVPPDCELIVDFGEGKGRVG